MIIRKIAFGDSSEAFIEDRLTGAVNIIYSNENNKGKTLVVQAALFAMGNSPIFPTGFNYKKYYFYVAIDIDSMTYEFLRKDGAIVIKSQDIWHTFSSISELKYYIDKNIFPLPRIVKGGEEKLVDPELYYQLFFIGQDKRNSSTVQNAGYYNKTDFKNMLRWLGKCSQSEDLEVDIETVKGQIAQKKTSISALKRKILLLKDNPQLASQTISAAERESAEKRQKIIDDIHQRISGLRKKKAREMSRRTRLETLLSELNSLNRTISVGRVKCGSCGSEMILYESNDLCFDLSNNEVRRNVIGAIKEQITLKCEIVGEVEREMSVQQASLSRELEETPVEQQHILIFKDDVVSQQQYSNEIVALNLEIEYLKDTLARVDEADESAKALCKEMMEAIVTEMQRLYRSIDPDGSLIFDDVFSKYDDTYSGSEGQEFYFCRLLSFNSYFKHRFPVVIDSFRSGELSTSKEQTMIEAYKGLGKQVLLTSTLKKEEYADLKYDAVEGVNAIDYSGHQNSRILQPAYADKFAKVIDSFGIADKAEEGRPIT